MLAQLDLTHLGVRFCLAFMRLLAGCASPKLWSDKGGDQRGCWRLGQDQHHLAFANAERGSSQSRQGGSVSRP